jgi:hypothetical protein
LTISDFFAMLPSTEVRRMKDEVRKVSATALRRHFILHTSDL